MRWIPVILLAPVALAIQTVVAPRVEIFHARPDVLLILLLFFVLYAPADQAVLTGWLLGAAADLLTVERRGLVTASYGLTAMAVVAVREYLFRFSLLTQFAVTLIACAFVRVSWLTFDRWIHAGADRGGASWGIDVIGSAIYTAVLAPPLFALLLRVVGLFRVFRSAGGYGDRSNLGGRDV